MKKMMALILSLMMMFSVALAEDISAEEAAPILENVKIHLYPSGEMEAGELEKKIRSYCLDKGISADIICTAKEQEDCLPSNGR